MSKSSGRESVDLKPPRFAVCFPERPIQSEGRRFDRLTAVNVDELLAGPVLHPCNNAPALTLLTVGAL